MSEQAERTPWLWISEGETRISDRYGYVTLVTDLNGQPAVYFDGDAMRELVDFVRLIARLDAPGKLDWSISTEDCIDTVASLIRTARAALAKVKGGTP